LNKVALGLTPVGRENSLEVALPERARHVLAHGVGRTHQGPGLPGHHFEASRGRGSLRLLPSSLAGSQLLPQRNKLLSDLLHA